MAEYICPSCKNIIEDDDALLCHFCGESLGRASSDVLGKMRGAGFKWILVTIILMLIAVFVILMLR